MPRLFSGIELPPIVRDDLEKLRQPLPSTRWRPAEDLHVTLRFIGDVPPPVAQEFAHNLENIVFDPFHIRINGLETFGGDDPRLLYASIEPNEPLLNLARANETAARRAGLKPESRKFIPHITLARLQAPRIDPIVRFLSRHGAIRMVPFLVTRFVLFSSKPLTGGGPYVIEREFPSSMGTFDDDEWDDDKTTGYDAH
ncbi:MAG: RNA 2',3'-cyclic phosphodiesterase [Alphaproteobacteria bacterium]|nr:RNA 2',3'-cyclic phosphodiesterase [Alphaproteobacteria bacterium]